MSLKKKCEGHNVWMEEKLSKRKFNDDGSPKAYHSHIDKDGNMCFGIKAQGDDSLSLNESKMFEEEMEEGDYTSQQKHEALNKLDQVTKEDEYRPLKRREWAYKEFNKSLSIISSDYRSEGMSPSQAVETGSLWQWLDFMHLNDEFYKEWKDEKRKIYMEILQNEKSDN